MVLPSSGGDRLAAIEHSVAGGMSGDENMLFFDECFVIVGRGVEGLFDGVVDRVCGSAVIEVLVEKE